MNKLPVTFLALAAMAAFAPLRAPGDTVYDRVYSALTSHPNRIVGSEALSESFAAVEKELRDAGLEPHYETFDSLVQKTERLDVVYGGAPVKGALMTDNGPAAFTLKKPIEGPAIFVGGGTLADIDGKDLKGAVAVIDVTRDGATVENVFTHGAAAAVLVGDSSLNAWRMRDIAFCSISLVPRIYLPREAADAAGLTSADGSKKISIDARSTIVDAAGKNLWVELPCVEGWTGRLETEETLVISATLDTYGWTPDYAPERRGAANCALLAQTACAIAREGKPLKRRVIVVFLGSRYGALEGARFFYHALDMSDASVNPLGFAERGELYDGEYAETTNLLAYAAANDIISSRGPEARELQQRLKKQFVALANRLRVTLGDLRLERERRIGAGTAETDASIAELDAAIASAATDRAACNELREQLVKGKLDVSDPDVARVYGGCLAEVNDILSTRRDELARMIVNNASWLELANVFKDRAFIGAFDFDFSSADAPWTLSMINDVGIFRFDKPDTGAFGRHLAAIESIYYGTNGIYSAEWSKAPLYRATLTPIFKPFSLSLPAQRSAPSGLPLALGYPGFQMITVGANLAHDNLPFADDFDLAPLAGQMQAFCRALGEADELSLRGVYSAERLETRLTYNGTKGASFMNYAAGSTDSEGLPRRAVLNITGFARGCPLPGQSSQPRTRILANGRVYMPYINRSAANTTWAFRCIAVGYDEDGAMDRVSNQDDSYGIPATPIHLFYANGGYAFNNGYGPDPIGGDFYHAMTLNAVKNALFKTRLSVPFDFEGANEFFVDRTDPVKIIGGNGGMLLGSVLLQDGSSAERTKAAMGFGVPSDADSRLRTDNIAQGARDAYILNESRLAVLRERNIVRDDLEKLHADAAEHIKDADSATTDRKWSLARAHEIFATCIENRVYEPLRGVTEDLVQAVVVLLLLSIPFAFAMERLIFGFPSIYKQILGFVGFFLATFGILFLTHPAFSLASAPIIIFLAFVIIMLACITTFIMMGKIKQEIKAMQGLASTVHGVDSDSSTTLSAILIGIAGMRNRPLKTFLTCITVVLLTFTILVFASFTASQGVVESYLGRGAGDDRIELHRLSFLEIDDEYIGALGSLYGDRFDIARRGGLFRVPIRSADTGDTPSNPEYVIFLPKSGESIAMSAVMGEDKAEFKRSSAFNKVCPDFGEPVPGAEDLPPIYLPPICTNALTRLEKGDRLTLNGSPFVFAGFFDTAALQSITTIDDLRAVPPDFQSTMSNSGSSATSGTSTAFLEQMSTGSFEWFSSEVIALAEMDALERACPLQTWTNFITLYPKNSELDLEDIGRELATAFHGSVHVKSPEGARQLFFTKAVEGSGFADVVVPLLLGGLIIFSSLMGSIVAREKEIFTYSALGLAPVDVGALFFAESAVYSVIGGMGGYLLSQLVAKLVKFLGSQGLMTPLEMNFSSLTSVSTILIVMAVVMLSTIFPAHRASKSANPGVARKWKMPNPTGDKLEFVFPFTVSSADFSGILSFIREHFQNHADATLGAFAARNVALFKEKDGARDRIGIEADVSLAPFDLGIFQKFRMYSQEFEIKGIDEVVVDLVRIGGTRESWVRSNRDFAAELREQFLLWRSLPIETIEHYRAATAEELSK